MHLGVLRLVTVKAIEKLGLPTVFVLILLWILAEYHQSVREDAKRLTSAIDRNTEALVSTGDKIDRFIEAQSRVMYSRNGNVVPRALMSEPLVDKE